MKRTDIGDYIIGVVDAISKAATEKGYKLTGRMKFSLALEYFNRIEFSIEPKENDKI